MSDRRRQLREQVLALRVPSGKRAPLKIPRKLKKAWKKRILQELPRHRSTGGTRRVRLHWVPGQGWTATITTRSYQVSRRGVVGADLK
jgi:hypothetical protein